jgi:Ca-activated chloride channel homolog
MKDTEMTDETLFQLKRLDAVAPSPEAKKLALNAAMVAFDAAQATKPRVAAKKNWFGSRWSVGAGVGLGTAAVALLVLPLGTQLYMSTSRPPVPTLDAAVKPSPVLPKPVVTTLATSSADAPKDKEQARLAAQQQSVVTAEPKPAEEVAATTTVNAGLQVAPASMASRKLRSVALNNNGAVQPEGDADLGVMTEAQDAIGGMVADAPVMAPMPSDGTMAGYAATQPSGDNFQKFDENRTKITRDEPVSTFSIDVDTASYSYVRGLLEAGSLPEPDAVRLEEMINYFPYDYPAPETADVPFKATMAVIPTPWNKKTELLEIGIKGYVPPAIERQPENLTFLIDTSGSMDDPNKLPLLKQSFGLLVDSLLPGDTVSIVTYAGSAGIVLPPTKASQRATILGALDRLEAGGSTAGAEGIELAYQVAAQSKLANGVNRVILATDGDFNVGIDTPDELKTFIKGKRDEGIFLSVLGFGRGNLDDALMQALAQNGDGNASYIDSFREAQKVLVEEGGANLVTIAKDVKVQIEFNPAQVSEYRLIGYETRALNREDFNNDAVDAGEIGAGHTVTALYEITPTGSGAEINDPLRYSSSAQPQATSDELGFLRLRYKAPEGGDSKLIETPITKALVLDDAAKAGVEQRFAAAVAAFGQKLKGSAYGEAMSWTSIIDLANGAKGADLDGYRAEFVQIVKLAALLAPDHAAKPSVAPTD